MAFCGSCGSTLRDGARFCGTCGRPTVAAPTGPPDTDLVYRPPPAAPAPPPPDAASRLDGPAGSPKRSSSGKAVLIAVLALVAIAVGVGAGLVLTAGDDTTGTDTEVSSGGDQGSDPDPQETEGDTTKPTTTTAPGSESETTFSGDAGFDVGGGNRHRFETGEAIVVEPAFDTTEGIDHIELLVDGEVDQDLSPGDEITTTLGVGTYSLRLRVYPIDGQPVRSDAVRVHVAEPILGNPAIGDSLRSVAQRYADALAAEDWAAARLINPALNQRTDADLHEGFENVDDEFVVPIRTLAPNVIVVGLVVHQSHPEEGPGAPQTRLFCNVWTIDPVGGTLQAEPGNSIEAVYPADADPYDYYDDLQGLC